MSQISTSQLSHPRRLPPHLSVCLRRTNPSSDQSSRGTDYNSGRPRSPPNCPSSGESNHSGQSNAPDARTWFNHSNKNPGGHAQVVMDVDPPFFLQRKGSSASNPTSDGAGPYHRSVDARHYYTQKASRPTATIGSSADDYRSVIDDLTIANKKLKERLRRYEKSRSSPLEKDRLFEVRMHGLSPQKKRELEETLRNFASSLPGSSGEYIPREDIAETRHRQDNLAPSRNTSSSNTSNSRPFDSAYASMSTSEPKSDFRRNHVSFEKKKPDLTSAQTKDKNIQSFLQDIPEGLLPKHSPVMTEKVKRKWVVRRLEQLFTGRRSSASGQHSQSQQQQEISKSAARDDRQEDQERGVETAIEGVREAQILSPEMELDLKAAKLLSSTSLDSSSSYDTTMRDTEPHLLSPDQRPTRPLDLDPNRAQIPADNIDYIRHLGLSAPELSSHDSADAAADAEGWVYLNLLISMAQLHIVNVTPAFVRSAVAEVSAKFQLSQDGRKIRWRGGTEGTRLSSDSGADSSGRTSQDSDSFEELSSKRRKIDNSPRHKLSADQKFKYGQPGESFSQNPSYGPFHYKPLFKHHSSSHGEGNSYDESISQNSYAPAYVNEAAQLSSARPHWNQQPKSVSSIKRKRDEGMVVFYNGMPFFTDLSGDAGDISPPRHVTEVGKDGYSNQSETALGSRNGALKRPEIARTTSGSTLPFRPFKDYSEAEELVQSGSRPRTPELVEDDGEDWMDFSPQWTSSNSQTIVMPVDLEASGLGGTRPADHFGMTITTTRTKLDGRVRARLSKFSAPGPKTKRILHNIPATSLDSFRSSSIDWDADNITARLAAIRADSPPYGQQYDASKDFPVKTKVLSMNTWRLNPSTLPAPSAYFSPISSSECSSDYTSSVGQTNSGPMPERASFIPVDISAHPKTQSAAAASISSASASGDQDMDIEDADSESEEDSDDERSSIDMLGHLRKIDPETVMAQERAFDAEAQRRLVEIPAGSSAATIGGGSGFSSEEIDHVSSSEGSYV